MRDTFNGSYGIMRDLKEFEKSYKFDDLQFIAGCGFESRTTKVLQQLSTLPHANVSCTIVDLVNVNDPNYGKAQKLQRPNMVKLEKIASKSSWELRRLEADLYSERFVAHRSLLNALASILKRFSGDFLVDISCLPRSIAFPVLQTLWETKRAKNLFVAFADDPTMGHLENQAQKFRSPYYIPTFYPEASSSSFRVWLPILGSDYRPIKKIWDSSLFNDIYPIVGFPSNSPIESDEIVRRNKAIIRGRTEKVVFASMYDPFKLAMKMNMLIDEIRSSLGADIRMVISPHGSKPQSIGAFLTAVTRKAAVLYCQPLSYHSLAGKVGESHIYWLKGDAYRG